MSIPVVTMNNGVGIPQLGLGIFQVQGPDSVETIATALRAGYRHVDTAQQYGNEAALGNAIERAGIDPDDVFVTSKLSNAFTTYDEARRSIDRTIAAVRVKRPDLFLVHWPMAISRDFMIVWRAMEEAYADGKFQAIGVANFQEAHLQRLLHESAVTPAVNQIETHPYLTQDRLRSFNAAMGVVTVAWSPLARGLVHGDPVIRRIAREVERTAGQVILRWHIQLGNVAIPKSSSSSHLTENLRVFDFQLSTTQMGAISALNRDHRTGANPDSFPEA